MILLWVDLIQTFDVLNFATDRIYRKIKGLQHCRMQRYEIIKLIISFFMCYPVPRFPVHVTGSHRS